MVETMKTFAAAAAVSVWMSGVVVAQTGATFYDRSKDAIRQIFGDPTRCDPGQRAQHKWVEWSKCLAEGAERMSLLFDYSPGVVRIVSDYQTRVQVIGQMIEDRILTKDDALMEIKAERDRFIKAMMPIVEDRVYREAAGER
jgi:hypothetical protein